MTCEEVQALAAELALGLLTGDERAEVVAHAGRCPSCQSEIDQLAGVADRLLLLAPEAEPAAGLVDRVTAVLDTPPARAAAPASPPMVAGGSGRPRGRRRRRRFRRVGGRPARPAHT